MSANTLTIKQKSYILIPKVVFSLLKSKDDFVITEFFFKLKGISNCGNIKKYRSKYDFLTIKLGLCESSIRQRIGLLKSIGLVRIEDGNLYISSKSKLLNYLGYNNNFDKNTSDVRFSAIKFHKNYLYNDINTIKIIDINTGLELTDVNDMTDDNHNKIYDYHNIKYYDNKGNYKLSYDKNNEDFKLKKKDFKHILYAYKIDSNLEQQKNTYTTKLINNITKSQFTETKEGKKSSYEIKINKRIKSQVDKNFQKLRIIDNDSVKLTFSNVIDIYGGISEKNRLNEFVKSNRNCNFTLSRKGIAKQSGFKSKATGCKIMKNLKRLDLISLDKKNEYLFNDNGNLFNSLLENKNLNKYGKIIFSTKQNSTKLILCNSIKIDKFKLEYGFKN